MLGNPFIFKTYIYSTNPDFTVRCLSAYRQTSTQQTHTSMKGISQLVFRIGEPFILYLSAIYWIILLCGKILILSTDLMNFSSCKQTFTKQKYHSVWENDTQIIKYMLGVVTLSCENWLSQIIKYIMILVVKTNCYRNNNGGAYKTFGVGFSAKDSSILSWKGKRNFNLYMYIVLFYVLCLLFCVIGQSVSKTLLWGSVVINNVRNTEVCNGRQILPWRCWWIILMNFFNRMNFNVWKCVSSFHVITHLPRYGFNVEFYISF